MAEATSQGKPETSGIKFSVGSPGVQTSGVLDDERMNFSSCKLPGVGRFVTAAPGSRNNTFVQ